MEIQSERDEEEGLDMKVIYLLDATEAYLKLHNSLSHTMRQGWLEIASARYSMGLSRISEALFSLKPCSAQTSISLDYRNGLAATYEKSEAEEAEGHISTSREKYPTCFTLHKWENKKEVENEVDVGFGQKRSASQLRHRPLSHSSDKSRGEVLTDNAGLESSSSSTVTQVQKRKSEALSLFGTLVSPQLRLAQGSFETALETLVQLANARSTMLSFLDQISKEKENKFCGAD
ncbi:hypothetical protein SUGI_0821980 [Cryptomeria japonica]|uniref:uncharacterized protein LOC131060005 n=1 Tax=Cryptomeria japonica TaxID=3369 RepID=UPI002414BAFA|nr:uncharacterized protein LOC131060005 [Cryptomeria japonica]GLJ40124.1 hypothetical protein SUGI_0821980 [Cryptomeria japonica]